MHPDFIEVYPDLLSVNKCNTIIEGMDKILDNRVTPYMQKHSVADSRVDEALFAEHDFQDAHAMVNDTITRAIELYVEKYSIIDTRNSRVIYPFSTWSVKLQKTPIGGGFHSWHSEVAGNNDTDRVLAWTLYLNSFEGEAETEFLMQHRRINPVAGSVGIWPSAWTHTHRGNPPYSKNKYIATGWFSFTGEKFA